MDSQFFHNEPNTVRLLKLKEIRVGPRYEEHGGHLKKISWLADISQSEFSQRLGITQLTVGMAVNRERNIF